MNGQNKARRRSVGDVWEAVAVLDTKVTRFNGQIAELTKETKATNLAMAKLPCIIHKEEIHRLAGVLEKIDEASIRKVGFQRDLFRSLLAAVVGAFATYVVFIASM